MITISRNLRQFIEDLTEGKYNHSSGAYIARRFGKELKEIARECYEEDLEEDYDVIRNSDTKDCFDYLTRFN